MHGPEHIHFCFSYSVFIFPVFFKSLATFSNFNLVCYFLRDYFFVLNSCSRCLSSSLCRCRFQIFIFLFLEIVGNYEQSLINPITLCFNGLVSGWPCELFQLLETQINHATLYPQQKVANLPIAGSYNQMAFGTCDSTHIKQPKNHPQPGFFHWWSLMVKT